MKPTHVYHWTHRKNLRAVLKHGLDPAKAHGKLAVVWACCDTRIAWALSHVSHCHGWDADDMVCLRIRVSGIPLVRTAMSRVVNVRTVIPPNQVDGILYSITDGFHDIDYDGK